MDINRRKIYRQIAEETGLPIKEVEKAIKAQFELVSLTIREGKFESIRLPHLGVFFVNEKRKEHLKRKLNINI